MEPLQLPPPPPVKTSSKAKPWLIVAGVVLALGFIVDALDGDSATASNSSAGITTSDCLDLDAASGVSDDLTADLNDAGDSAISLDVSSMNDALDRVVEDSYLMLALMEPDSGQYALWAKITNAYSESRDAAAEGDYESATIWMNTAGDLVDQSTALLRSDPPTRC